MRGGLNEADRHDRAHAVGQKSIETRSSSHQRSGQLADYYPTIFHAVSRLEPNATETRGKIYEPGAHGDAAAVAQRNTEPH